MSEINRESLETILPQLKCHFTWNLFREGSMPSHLEDRVCNQVENLNSEEKATMYDLLAYIKHLDGESKAALECLGQAEVLRKSEHNDQAEIQLLVTWGNYAWIYYHMGCLSEAQAYVDKVRQVCQKFANPYSMECPELDCEEGWTRLKCGRNERAKMCFEKSLEEKPKDSECSSGMAIAMFRLGEKPEKQFSVDALKQAIELNPQNQYVKVLLALKLLRMGEEAEGERMIKDALEKAPNQTDVLQKAAQFYKKKGNLDRAIELLEKALRSTVNNSSLYSLVLCRYREILKQLQKTGDAHSSERRQRMGELRRLTMEYMQKTLQRRRSPLNSYSDLLDFPEVKRCYQMVISKESPDVEEEDLYERYCNLQEYHRKSEDLAALKCFVKFPRHERSIKKEEAKQQT
ncbi:interferon-induced protein with tetratricopeptide repeats 3-like [Mus caroli]|uniref:Interferon-induced protein with tetratricopeptide repeats 3-like n=1 Tax=Mus caroli TaxID=10089 RepID=A0A6P5NX87_MUSCR|nr:interferon-induced protein with tetratricopeptide repeats 3-like [Mus caroli]